MGNARADHHCRRLAPVAACALALVLVLATPAVAAPSVTTSGGETSYTSGGPDVVVDPGVTVAAPDGAVIQSATVRIATNLQSNDELSGHVEAGMNATYDATAGVLTMSPTDGTRTPAEWQEALRTVRYAHRGSFVSGSKTVEFRVTNQLGEQSAAATKTLAIPVYQAPNGDDDRDGYRADVDCDDNEETVHPGAHDVPGDGVDQDCKGGDAPHGDADGDGSPDNHDVCPALSDAGQQRTPRDGCPKSFGARPTSGSDRIVGSAFADLICGLGGDDTLSGAQGGDTLFGDACDLKQRLVVGAAQAAGNDALNGGEGADKLYGAGGRDKLDGGKGNDMLDGGRGNDRLSGGAGRNSYRGGPGDDTIAAANGQKETVDCGTGTKDVARVDRIDKVKGCEKVTRAK